GKMFSGFLDLKACCEACGLDYAFVDAGDGPAVFVILFAGFVVVGAGLVGEALYAPPLWVHAAVWLPLVLLPPLLPLPASSGGLGQGGADGVGVWGRGGGGGGAGGRGAVTSGAPDRGGLLVPSIAAACAFAVLIGLGTWQVQRKAWKEALIATVSERFAAPPVALPPPAEWPRLAAEMDEFRRVRFKADFVDDKEALVFTTGSSLHGGDVGPGYWVFTPARVRGRLVM